MMRRVHNIATIVAAATVIPVSVGATWSNLAATTTTPTTSTIVAAASTPAAPGTSSVPGPAGSGGTPAIGPVELGIGPIALVAPAETAAGDRPLFSWSAVDGAATYSLAVLTAANEPLWAWTGSTTEVILGGWPAPPDPAAPGPLLLGPSAWFVAAYDAGGIPIAVSDMRPVSPT